MKTKSKRKGHNKGIQEVVSRGYTHVGWRLTRNGLWTPTKLENSDAHHDRRQR